MPGPSRSNPDSIGVNNEYAGFKAPKRADATTTGGRGDSYYKGDPAGNIVDKGRMNRTKDAVSNDKSTVFPGGVSSGGGY